MANEKKHNKAEKLYDIYETFIEQLVIKGWKGEHFGWMETCRSDLTAESWIMFELDNGFCLGLNEPAQDDDCEPVLQYWFEDGSEQRPIEVESLEQLLELLN